MKLNPIYESMRELEKERYHYVVKTTADICDAIDRMPVDTSFTYADIQRVTGLPIYKVREILQSLVLRAPISIHRNGYFEQNYVMLSKTGQIIPGSTLTIRNKCHVIVKTNDRSDRTWLQVWNYQMGTYITGDGSKILEALSCGTNEDVSSPRSIGADIVRRMIEDYENRGL